MAAIERFEDIKAWQMARELTHALYETTKGTAFARDYGLCDRVTQASGSIMHNIADRFDSETNGDLFRFLEYAKRSCIEGQSELYVALDLKHIDEQALGRLYALSGETRAASWDS